MKYPMFKVHIPIKESLTNIESVFNSGFINEGSEVTELTQKLSKRFQTDNIILTNSCTSALTVAMKIAGVKTGTSVATVSMTCIATNCPIQTLGAGIEWVDIDPKTGNMSVQDLKSVLENNKNIKAVVIVAWAGLPPHLDVISGMCALYNVPLILDAAHAFGALYKDKPIHYWADFTCYSFQAIKHFTTGDGGALVCKNESTFNQASHLKWFGIDRDASKDKDGNWKGQRWGFDVEVPGFKFNMNNISAAIGLAQLVHIDNILQAHRNNAITYAEEFVWSKIKPLNFPKGSVPSHWVYTVRIPPERRDEIIKKLNDEGISAGLVHFPNHIYSAFEAYKRDLPGTEEFFNSQISLPCGWWLKESDARHIATRTRELVYAS